jgi:hypothetical protein
VRVVGLAGRPFRIDGLVPSDHHLRGRDGPVSPDTFPKAMVVMKAIETRLPGVLVVEPKIFRDARGYSRREL